MPKQEFDLLDYMAPLVVALIFAILVLIISFTIINFYCITRKDDLTVFEKIGKRVNIRLGPHSMTAIRRGGYASTYFREEERERKMTLLRKESAAAAAAAVAQTMDLKSDPEL